MTLEERDAVGSFSHRAIVTLDSSKQRLQRA